MVSRRKTMYGLIIACLFLVACSAIPAWAVSANVSLAWDANTEKDLAGYKVYWCVPPTSSVACTKAANSGVQDVGNQTSVALSQAFGDGATFFVTAYDTGKNESGPSNKIVLDLAAPAPPTQLKITVTVTITQQ